MRPPSRSYKASRFRVAWYAPIRAHHVPFHPFYLIVRLFDVWMEYRVSRDKNRGLFRNRFLSALNRMDKLDINNSCHRFYLLSPPPFCNCATKKRRLKWRNVDKTPFFFIRFFVHFPYFNLKREILPRWESYSFR